MIASIGAYFKPMRRCPGFCWLSSGAVHCTEGGGLDFASKDEAEPLNLLSMADQDEGPVFVTQPVNVGAGE
jgi:hypothetical protein